ncbi:MAG: metal ABC transporter substrate-binding protein [Actinomycetes bacterium]
MARPGSVLRGILVLGAGLVALTACGATPPADASASDGQRLDVLASFYPLQFAAQRVGGDRVTVDNLTKPGAEPHDLELAPQDVAAVARAGLVVYLSGFQPAVDDAVVQSDTNRAFDVASVANLDRPGDPHFWLDPTRLADVGDAIAQRLTTVDPAGAATYRANATTLRHDLQRLDREFARGLRSCRSRDIVTSHEAFGYLAQRYDLQQVGIAGMSPDTEPTASDLADVTAYVKAHNVTTIYYETLVSPTIAETVARETGAQVAVLDPIEGLAPGTSDSNYLTVMRDNLVSLRAGLGCR